MFKEFNRNLSQLNYYLKKNGFLFYLLNHFLFGGERLFLDAALDFALGVVESWKRVGSESSCRYGETGCVGL